MVLSFYHVVATLQKIWECFLDTVFPPICIVCRRLHKDFLCSNCRSSIEINNSFFCPECDRRLPEAKNFCHPDCKFILAAAAPYENKSVRELIHALKYDRVMATLDHLEGIGKSYMERVFRNQGAVEGFIAMPIPLHPQKERERGFNQAELIAGILNDELGITVNKGNLVRVKNTKSQTGMKDGEERGKNVSRAFSLKRPEEVTGKNIVLVDDVFTSGATMREAVRVLKTAGARKVIGFVIAKT